jgi:hypothetical protein
MKIRPVGAEVSHADWHDEAFRNFANARRNGIHTTDWGVANCSTFLLN